MMYDQTSSLAKALRRKGKAGYLPRRAQSTQRDNSRIRNLFFVYFVTFVVTHCLGALTTGRQVVLESYWMSMMSKNARLVLMTIIVLAFALGVCHPAVNADTATGKRWI